MDPRIKDFLIKFLPTLKWIFLDCIGSCFMLLVLGLKDCTCRGSLMYGIHTLNITVWKNDIDKEKLKSSKLIFKTVAICYICAAVEFAITYFLETLTLHLAHDLIKGHVESEEWQYVIRKILHLILYLFWHVVNWVYVNAANFYWWKELSDQAKRYEKAKTPSYDFLHVLADYIITFFIHILLNAQGNLLLTLSSYFLDFQFWPLSLVLRGVVTLVSYTLFATAHSLYAFDYRWNTATTHIGHRLQTTLKHWPYFLGFGLPVTIVESYCAYLFPSIPGKVKSLCIVALFYPIMILGAGKTPEYEVPECLQINIFWVVELIISGVNTLVKKMRQGEISNRLIRTLLFLDFFRGSGSGSTGGPGARRAPPPVHVEPARPWSFQASDLGQNKRQQEQPEGDESVQQHKRSVQRTPYVSRSTPKPTPTVTPSTARARRKAPRDAPVFSPTPTKPFQ